MADPAKKTMGDYGVEVEAAVANGSCTGVEAVVAEMRSTMTDAEKNPAPATPPAPTNQGIKAYADNFASGRRQPWTH